MNTEAKNFTVYKSSAGSGKTYTLVKEYLSIALQCEKPSQLRHILAITFTNKAAAEMKDRIISTLYEFASGNLGKSQTMFDKIAAEYGIEKNVLVQRSQQSLSYILHHYSDFAVSTIDKFNHKIIRAFAFDLKLPVNFEIEIDTEKVLNAAVDLLLEQAGQNEQLTQLLVNFLDERLDEEKGWNIHKELVKFGSQLFNDNNNEKIDALKSISLNQFYELNKEFTKHIQVFKQTVVNYGAELLQIVSLTGVDIEYFAGGKNGIVKYMQYLQQFEIAKLEPTPTVQKYFSGDKLYAGKASASDQSSINHVAPQLVNLYNKATSYIEKNKDNFKLYYLVKANLYSLALLNELEKQVIDIKQNEGIILISEFNKIISNAIANEPAPYIYERLGERYHQFLIDEFQDTSVLQWHNMLPLVDNALSQGYFCMIVGDGKQSIYRWRNGEVEQFAQLPKIFSKAEKTKLLLQREGTLERNYDEKFLENNFRSKKEIVEFNNHFFEYLTALKELPDCSSIYNKHVQQFDAKNMGGSVNMQFFEGASDERSDWMLTNILEKILLFKSQHYELNDIAILTRGNNEAAVITEFLLANDVEIISKESLLLSSSAEVQFMVAVLKFLLHHQDEISICAMILYLQQYKHLNAGVVDGYSQKHLIDFFKANNINFSVETLILLPLYEMVEKIAMIFKLNEKKSPYLLFFKEQVFQFSLKDNNLSNFIDWWQEKENKLSITLPDGMKGINMLTIHKSK
jgi:ATP-dependent exoDNAse (exonuclease V) beta subunit